MAKEPADRYATAQELADDLRRFLEDKPIRAKRPGLVDRAANGLRRHPAIVGAAFVILILVTAGLLVSTLLIAHQQELTAAALKAEAW